MATTDSIILELRGVSKRFGAVQALQGVDLVLRPGEVVALVGDNGAGKSTLIKGVAGIHPFDEGETHFDGRPVAIHGPHDAAELGIEIVYQDLALADNLDVAENMYLGRERTGRFGLLAEEEMERASADTMAGLAVTTLSSVRQRVAGLSGGQRQTVAVGKAVMWNSRVVILDEPTAALGVAQTAQVLDLVKRLGNQGLAVLLVSHNLHDVFEVADRIVVLRLGQLVGDLDATQVTQQQVVEAITAGSLSSVPGMATHATGPGAKSGDGELPGTSGGIAESGGGAAESASDESSGHAGPSGSAPGGLGEVGGDADGEEQP